MVLAKAPSRRGTLGVALVMAGVALHRSAASMVGGMDGGKHRGWPIAGDDRSRLLCQPGLIRPVLHLRGANRTDPRGARRGARSTAPQPCIRLDPLGVRTMKQSFASATGLRGGGPILDDGARARGRLGLPPPRIVLGADHPGRVVGTEARWFVLTPTIWIMPADAARRRAAPRRCGPGARAQRAASARGRRSWSSSACPELRHGS